MILIAHRGNIYGPNPDRENSHDYLREALAEGYHVETDVWLQPDGSLHLGHDEPQYKTSLEFLQHDPRIICHAKTVTTFQFLITNGLHCFFHDNDEATLTSQNKIWLYPGIFPYSCPDGIIVMPEWSSINYKDITICNTQYSYSDWLECILLLHKEGYYAICSDHVGKIRDILQLNPSLA